MTYMSSRGILVNDGGEDGTNGAPPFYPHRSCGVVKGEAAVKSTRCPLRLHVPPSFGGIIFFPRRTTYPPPSPASSTPSPSPPCCWGGFFLVAVDEGPTHHPSSTAFTPSITGGSSLWQCMPYTPPLSLPVCT